MSELTTADPGPATPPGPASPAGPAIPLDAGVDTGMGTAGAAGSALFGRGLLYVVVWSLQTVAAVVVSPVLAYVLGPAEFGRLASAIALHQVLIVLAVFGLDQALVLQRSQDPDARAARGLLPVAFVLAAGVTLAVGLTGPLWAATLGFGSFSHLLLATILWTAPGAAVQVMLALLLAEDRLKAFTAVSALSAVGGQVFGIALLFGHSRDASTYAWGGVISQFGAMAIGIFLTRPVLRGLADRATARRAIRLGLPLAMSALAVYVFTAGDRIVVQRTLGAVQVGRYQVAYTVGYVVVLLLTFTSQAWSPRFAAVRDEQARWQIIGRARDELYRLLLPLVLGITLGAPVALRIVAPPSFQPNTLLVVVYLVAMSAFPVATSFGSGQALITARRARPLALVAGVAAVVNIALNIALVPVIGIAGSALATVLAFTIQALLQLRLLRAGRAWPRTSSRLWLAVAAVGAISGLSVLLPQTPAWNIVRLVAGIACLPWFLARLRVARRADALAGP